MTNRDKLLEVLAEHMDACVAGEGLHMDLSLFYCDWRGDYPIVETGGRWSCMDCVHEWLDAPFRNDFEFVPELCSVRIVMEE